jgi:hypothetical protein
VRGTGGFPPRQGDRRSRPRAHEAAAAVPLLHPNDVGNLRRTVRKGDVVLVEGDQRVSEVIKYLTQSSWSHAALYVGDELLRRFPDRREELVDQYGIEAEHMIVEALMEGGVIASPIVKYATMNMRICRPRSLRADDLARVLAEVTSQLGLTYDVQHILDLARYFFPVTLIPPRLRRKALEVGGDLTTNVICSSMIGRAFQNVASRSCRRSNPRRRSARAGWIGCAGGRRTTRSCSSRQRETLITPRDFDLSPYFDVVKFNSVELGAFDYKRIRWA